MADEENTEEEQPKSGKKKLIIIIVAAVLLLGGIGGGVWFYLQPGETEELAEGEEGEVIEEEGSSFFGDDNPKALYHELRPEFIVTFEANSRQRYVQMNVTLVTRDEEIISVLVNNDPVIRNTLVLLFSKQDYLELQTREGKEMLKKSATKALQNLMMKEIGKKGVETVLFTNFVMQ